MGDLAPKRGGGLNPILGHEIGATVGGGGQKWGSAKSARIGRPGRQKFGRFSEFLRISTTWLNRPSVRGIRLQNEVAACAPFWATKSGQLWAGEGQNAVRRNRRGLVGRVGKSSEDSPNFWRFRQFGKICPPLEGLGSKTRSRPQPHFRPRNRANCGRGRPKTWFAKLVWKWSSGSAKFRKILQTFAGFSNLAKSALAYGDSARKRCRGLCPICWP